MFPFKDKSEAPVFIGLRNIGGMNCQNGECLGNLAWTDGSAFDYHPDDVDIFAKRETECMIIRNAKRIEAFSCFEEAKFLCQFDCNKQGTYTNTNFQ